MPLNSYEENRILSASPLELVQILYAAALRAVQQARDCIRSGNIAGRSREISKTQEILLELAASVETSQASELSERLLALYDYMQGRLVEANVEQKEAPLEEVSKLLGVLQQAWSECPAAAEAVSPVR